MTRPDAEMADSPPPALTIEGDAEDDGFPSTPPVLEREEALEEARLSVPASESGNVVVPTVILNNASAEKRCSNVPRSLVYKLLCILCQRVCNDAYVVNCRYQHRFCRACILHRWSDLNNTSCPRCDDDIPYEPVCDPTWNRVIEELNLNKDDVHYIQPEVRQSSDSDDEYFEMFQSYDEENKYINSLIKKERRKRKKIQRSLNSTTKFSMVVDPEKNALIRQARGRSPIKMDQSFQRLIQNSLRRETGFVTVQRKFKSSLSHDPIEKMTYKNFESNRDHVWPNPPIPPGALGLPINYLPAIATHRRICIKFFEENDLTFESKKRRINRYLSKYGIEGLGYDNNSVDAEKESADCENSYDSRSRCKKYSKKRGIPLCVIRDRKTSCSVDKSFFPRFYLDVADNAKVAHLRDFLVEKLMKYLKKSKEVVLNSYDIEFYQGVYYKDGASFSVLKVDEAVKFGTLISPGTRLNADNGSVVLESGPNEPSPGTTGQRSAIPAISTSSALSQRLSAGLDGVPNPEMTVREVVMRAQAGNAKDGRSTPKLVRPSKIVNASSVNVNEEHPNRPTLIGVNTPNSNRPVTYVVRSNGQLPGSSTTMMLPAHSPASVLPYQTPTSTSSSAKSQQVTAQSVKLLETMRVITMKYPPQPIAADTVISSFRTPHSHILFYVAIRDKVPQLEEPAVQEIASCAKSPPP